MKFFSRKLFTCQKKKKRNDHSKPGLYLKYSALSMCGHLFLLISPNSLTIITINLFLSGLIPQKPFITLFFGNCPPVLPKTPLRAASISSVCSSYSRNSWKKQVHHTPCTVHLWNFHDIAVGEKFGSCVLCIEKQWCQIFPLQPFSKNSKSKWVFFFSFSCAVVVF